MALWFNRKHDALWTMGLLFNAFFAISLMWVDA
jgi:hypothetical protein